MKPIWAEAAQVGDVGEYGQFTAGTSQNLADARVLSYPATKILKTSDGEKNIVYMPVQQCQVWESLGLNPNASELEIASALKAIAHVLRFCALSDGQGEIYFLCSEERTQKFAAKNGFEKVEIPLYRMRVR